MARAPKEYEKLPGKGRPNFAFVTADGVTRLWLAQDHLLKVETSYWIERYRRYYLKDIRLLQLTKTNFARIANFIFGILAAFFAVLALLTKDGAAGVSWVIAVVFAVCVIINLALGPRCKAVITTPLGTDDLPSLSRLRVARKVFDRLAPLIRQAQENLGDSDPVALASRLSVETPGPRSVSGIPTIAQSPPDFSDPPQGKKSIAILFALLALAHAGLSLLLELQPAPWIFPAAASVLVIAFGFCITLLIRPAPGCPRKITVSFVVWLGIYCMLLYVLLMQAIISDPSKMTNQAAMYPAMFSQAMHHGGFNTFLNIFATAVSGSFGLLILGLVLTNRTEIEEIELPPPVPPVSSGAPPLA